MNKQQKNPVRYKKRNNWTHTATTVFPAEVWAETKTDWLFSKHNMASFWKGSRMNGYSLEGLLWDCCKGTKSRSGGTATWNKK